MAHFFGPVGSTASGAGKGLVTCIKKSYVQMEGKTVQLHHSRTEDIETFAGPKSSGHAAKKWSCPKNCENMQNLIGTKILHVWDNKDRQGWFEGRVHERNLNARDLARAPTANFFVRYSKSLTIGVKKKKTIPLCHVAHELTNRTYGEKKWWVVIVKDQ